jgi:hypothetical protein
MSEIKHTPGIWSVGPKGGCVVSDQPIPGIKEGTGHADTEYYGGHLIAESIWRKEDARLIAAAPELLDALKEAIETIKFLSTRDNSWGEQIVCEDLQAIVAKATRSQS